MIPEDWLQKIIYIWKCIKRSIKQENFVVEKKIKSTKKKKRRKFDTHINPPAHTPHQYKHFSFHSILIDSFKGL